MSPQTGSLTFKVINPNWDDNILEFEIIAAKNDWRTSIRCHGYADVFKDFGNQLKSFPKNTNHVVPLELGAERPNKNPHSAYYLLLRAYCYDMVGHTAVEIALNNNSQNPDTQNARFNIFSEPEQINKLGKQLFEWDPMTQSELVWETKI